MNKSMENLLKDMGRVCLIFILGMLLGITLCSDLSVILKVVIAVGIVSILVLFVVVFHMGSGKKETLSSKRMSSIDQNARISRTNRTTDYNAGVSSLAVPMSESQVSRNPLDRKPMSAEKKEQKSLNKVRISKIMLMNEQGKSLMEWSLSSKTSLIIGKSSPKEPVDIDLADSAEAMMISKQHAVLNYTEKGWYIDDIDSKNGTRVKKSGQNSIMDVKLVGAIEVEAGDIIYIANTVLKVE